jgi:hypothetical protein
MDNIGEGLNRIENYVHNEYNLSEIRDGVPPGKQHNRPLPFNH